VIPLKRGPRQAGGDSDDGPDNTYAAGERPANVAQSIGRRVGNDPSGFFIGLAGLPSVTNATWMATGTTINTISYAPSSIYPGAYLLPSRLFLMRATDVQSTIIAVFGGQDRVNQENALFNFMSNKCNMKPICTKYGFVPSFAGNCTDSCGSPKENGNIVCLPDDPSIDTTKQNIGSGDFCDGSHPCNSAGFICTAGVCP
jgi:hypothetical protein